MGIIYIDKCLLQIMNQTKSLLYSRLWSNPR